MSEVVELRRASRPSEPRPFEDPRWAERHSAETAQARDPRDCACTLGTVCRHNNACPRLAAAGRSALSPT